MKRQITIYESARNGKITVFNDVECNTLSELKTLLREKGIDYGDKEFVEGVTNTKLLSDDSRIPTNIPFKGNYTNDVFINILNKDTKIKSGVNYAELSRGDLLRAAKPYAQEIEDEFGANYTRVKSSDIAEFLEKKDNESDNEDYGYEYEGTEEKECHCNVEHKLNVLLGAVRRLAEICDCEDEIEEELADFWEGEKKEKDDTEVSNFSFEDIQGFIRK
jgi:hypothetical protein